MLHSALSFSRDFAVRKNRMVQITLLSPSMPLLVVLTSEHHGACADTVNLLELSRRLPTGNILIIRFPSFFPPYYVSYYVHDDLYI